MHRRAERITAPTFNLSDDCNINACRASPTFNLHLYVPDTYGDTPVLLQQPHKTIKVSSSLNRLAFKLLCSPSVARNSINLVELSHPMLTPPQEPNHVVVLGSFIPPAPFPSLVSPKSSPQRPFPKLLLLFYLFWARWRSVLDARLL